MAGAEWIVSLEELGSVDGTGVGGFLALPECQCDRELLPQSRRHGVRSTARDCSAALWEPDGSVRKNRQPRHG